MLTVEWRGCVGCQRAARMVVVAVACSAAKKDAGNIDWKDNGSVEWKGSSQVERWAGW